ncbi:MAG: potassium/proton antiporter [Clostridia bacterium]|nr:potassium/proton antiporter [Clostridia bacterium]
MHIYLLLAALVMFVCVLLNKVSSRLGIPTLLAFIVLGMVFGSDGLLKIPFDNYLFAERICSIALIFIMFYGGFGTNWRAAKPVALRAALLSGPGVVLTAGLVGLFCHYVLGIGLLEGLLIGSVISSTDAASVFSILRSKKLGLKYNTASLLEVESGSNDPFAYMLTTVILSIMDAGTADWGKIIYLLFSQLVYGAGIGVAIAMTSAYLLKRIRFSSPGFDAVFVTAVAVLSYAAPAAVGGNGYLSAYIVGIVLGNTEIRNKKTLFPFFDGVTGLMQMLIFFLLGLLSFPSALPEVALTALLIALFLTFVARPAAVFAILAPFGCKIRQMLVVSWAGLRGAASIVFAIIAYMDKNTVNDIFHIIFFIVLFSILFQGSLIPVVSKKLGMIDTEADVMKTFSDYTDEVPVQFIQVTVSKGHAWCDRQVMDITLPPDTLLVMLERNKKREVPNGGTLILEGDVLILSARSPEKAEDVYLVEQHINADDAEVGKHLWETSDKEGLVILIKRGNSVIIPNGSTLIQAGDTLVYNKPQ